MEKLIFLIVSVYLGACSTSQINYQTTHSPDQFYHHILLLYIEGDLNFQKLDKYTYQFELMGRYNNLAEMEYRNHLEKALSRNLNSPLTRITQRSGVFPLTNR